MCKHSVKKTADYKHKIFARDSKPSFAQPGVIAVASSRLLPQQDLPDKVRRISVLLSHLCESMPPGKLAPEPHKWCSHLPIHLNILMSEPSSFHAACVLGCGVLD